MYWREPAQSASSSTVNVTIQPKWKAGVHPRVKTAFDRKYKLVCTADWVEAAGHLHVSSRGAMFQARIDADRIGRTGAHYAEIRGFCLVHGSADECEQTGADFFVPITVVIAEGAEAASPNGVDTGYSFVQQPRGNSVSTQGVVADPAGSGSGRGIVQSSGADGSGAGGSPSLTFGPGHLERRFVLVPPGASWCDISIRRVDAGSDDDGAELLAGGDKASATSMQGGFGSPLSTPSKRAHMGASQSQASIADEERQGTMVPSGPGSVGQGTTAGAGGEQPVLDSSPRIACVHAVQVQPHVSLSKSGMERYMRLRPGEEGSMSMPVVAGLTLEVCVGQYWSSLGSSSFQIQVKFRGVSVQGSGSYSSGSGLAHLRP